MNSETPKVEIVKSCSGGGDLTAYASCHHYVLQICDLETRSQTAYDSCLADARRIETEDSDQNEKQEKSLESSVKLKAINDISEQGKKMLNQAKVLAAGLADPRHFLAKALEQHNIQLLHKLTQDPSYSSTKGVNPEMTEEVYRFAQRFAKVGFEATPNPLIRTIQLELLRHIGDVFKSDIRTLEDLSESMRAFNADSQRPVPKAIPPAGCSIFTNEAASRDLMQRDSERWLALYQQCAR